MLDEGAARPAEPPLFDDVLDYPQAFYHGLQPMGGEAQTQTKPPGIFFHRPSRRIHRLVNTHPDSQHQPRRPFLAPAQPDDLLDAAISILPPDAYALLLLVDHDLYEDEVDDFLLRARYGGSRVAMVSSARYNPLLMHGGEGGR